MSTAAPLIGLQVEALTTLARSNGGGTRAFGGAGLDSGGAERRRENAADSHERGATGELLISHRENLRLPGSFGRPESSSPRSLEATPSSVARGRGPSRRRPSRTRPRPPASARPR